MINALVLFQLKHASQNRSALVDHVQFLSHAPERVRAAYVNLADDQPFDPRWRSFDVVVLHGTVLDRQSLAARVAAGGSFSGLTGMPGIVIAMPDAETDHAHVLDSVLASAGAHIIVTNHDLSTRALLYPRMHSRAYFIDALPAYVNPARVAQARAMYRPLAQREIDVLYRGRELPFDSGRLGQCRTRMVQALEPLLVDAGYSTDISLRANDLAQGDAWLDLLGRARVALGTERGSSVLDRRGEIGAHVRALRAEDSALTFDAVDVAMEGELSRHHIASIAPRQLEAVITRTAQLLIEGQYSGVLTPWTHYIPLKADLSNLSEVMAALADTPQLEQMVERAYADIVESRRYSYGTFTTQLLDVVDLFRSLRAAA
jgi:hypothetical protein